MTNTSLRPTADRFVEEARNLIGTPWVHQGRDERGIDCLGLVVACGRRIGIDVEDNLNYGRAPDFDTMKAYLYRQLVSVNRYAKQLGDLYMIKWPRDAYPCHLAIVSGDNTIIHADFAPPKKVYEIDFPKKWEPYIYDVLRWNGWAHG